MKTRDLGKGTDYISHRAVQFVIICQVLLPVNQFLHKQSYNKVKGYTSNSQLLTPDV